MKENEPMMSNALLQSTQTILANTSITLPFITDTIPTAGTALILTSLMITQCGTFPTTPTVEFSFDGLNNFYSQRIAITSAIQDQLIKLYPFPVVLSNFNIRLHNISGSSIYVNFTFQGIMTRQEDVPEVLRRLTVMGM